MFFHKQLLSHSNTTGFSMFIFDLDGTIIDSLPDIHTSLMNTLNNFSLPLFDKNITKALIGDGIEKLILKAVGEQNFKKEILEYFKFEYEKHITDKTTLIKGIKQLLDFLYKKHATSVILTNKLFVFTDKIIEHFNLGRFFTDWYGGDSFEEKKPSGLPIIKILAKNRVDKEKALIIGDNYTDIQAGVNAEIKTCFCEYGYGKLNGLIPYYTIKKPLDLLEIIKNG